MVMSSGETGRWVGETLASEKHFSTDKKESLLVSQKGARQSSAADPKRRIRLFAKYN